MIQGSERHASVAIGSRERRGEDRDEVYFRTVITTLSGGCNPAEVINISPTGFLIRTKHNYRRRERMRVLLPSLGEVPAEVAWSLAGCAGCQLIYPIELADYPGFLLAARTVRSDWMERAR